MGKKKGEIVSWISRYIARPQATLFPLPCNSPLVQPVVVREGVVRRAEREEERGSERE